MISSRHGLGSILLALLVLSGCTGGSSVSNPEAENTPGQHDPVVATFDDTTITLSKFEAAYRDANTGATPADDSLPAYKEFLEQYVNYRLKVRAAREAGLDTLSDVQKEIQSYRRDLTRPKVMESNVYEPLVRELYERRKKEVDVSHILIRVSPNASPADTLEAYRQARALNDSLEKGIPFSDLAYRHSEDPSAKKKGQRGFRGHLGYLRAGQIVERFENRMYKLPPDSTSDVFRTRFGYHLLTVHDRRRAQPPFRLSHIMLRPEGDTATATRRLDSLRTEIVQNNASFDSLARKHSEDRRSAAKGGDLGQVDSPQSLPPAFRRAVAELDTIGAVSDVVKSQYGIHLIQLTDRETRKSLEASYDDLKKKIADRPRVDRRKKAFARSVLSEVGSTVDTAQILRHGNLATLDTLSRPLLPQSEDSASTPSVPIATLGDSTFTLRQLSRHVLKTDGGARMTVAEVLNDFLDKKAFQYAHAQLETQDPTVAAQMKEYRDGLLAFRFMQDSVWTVATRDTTGLRRLYKQQRNTYRFPERVRTIVLRARADSVLRRVQSGAIDTSHAVLVENASNDSLVSVDTVMVTDNSPEVYRRVDSLKDGTMIGPIQQDGTALLLIRDQLLLPRTKTFEEARSAVVRDYQDHYEQTVLSRLRERYTVETYPERLRHAFTTARRNSRSNK